jgi:hypothetical protein
LLPEPLGLRIGRIAPSLLLPEPLGLRLSGDDLRIGRIAPSLLHPDPGGLALPLLAGVVGVSGR